jgi:hypothetical protein
MGYETYYTGTLTITPQIPEPFPACFTDVTEDTAFILRNEAGEQNVVLKDDGTFGVVGDPGVTLAEVCWDESTKADIGEYVESLVKFVKREGSEANGVVDCQGEEHRDIYRYRVVNNAIGTERPKLVWPNGDEETL